MAPDADRLVPLQYGMILEHRMQQGRIGTLLRVGGENATEGNRHP
jgi:hypothetical protein